jgi:EpsD family peptidyl-prolyl cis-trans isomerase
LKYLAVFVAGVLSALAAVLVVAFTSAERGASGRAAVTVNGIPITDNQIRSMVGRLQGAWPDDDARRRAAVERLIEQQLLASAALADKVHDEPQVADALADARNQILAQIYIDRKTASLPAPSASAIAAYYDGHPELFSERRVYRLQEIVIEVPGAQRPAVEAQYGKIRTLNDMIAWLDANRIPYRTGAAEKPAEALPADLLPHLAKLKEGETVRVATPIGLTIVQLVGSRPAPLQLAEARPSINGFLANQAKAAAVRKLVQELRTRATIEYPGRASNEPAK